jgi:acetate kinase
LLGLVIDPQRNEAAVGREDEIQTPESRVKVLVIATNEELAIARDTYQIAMEHPGS